MPRRNVWSASYKGLRALLYDIGAGLQATDFLDPEASGRAVSRLRGGCRLMSRHAAVEESVYHEPLRARVPDLVARLAAEHERLRGLMEALLGLSDQVTRSEGDRRNDAGQRLVHAFDEFTAAYLTHLLEEGDGLSAAARGHFTDAEVDAWHTKVLADISRSHAREYIDWIVPSLDDHELAGMLRDANHSGVLPAFATLSADVREAVGGERYTRVMRVAGLDKQLEFPFTPTGAELIGEEEERNVLEVLRRRRLWRYEVSSTQSFVARFEAEAEDLLGVRHVHTTVSGTAALQIALMGLGVGPGDEVIIPAVTWVGCADAVILCGAVPVPARVDETLGIDPSGVRQKLTSRTKAIMGVSLYGNPCDIAALRELADSRHVALLEDNCQSAGVSYRGRRLGGFGDAAVFSTNLMKFISAGDGGFIATDRDDVYEFAVMYTGGKVFPSRKRHMKLRAPNIPFSTLRMNELTGAVALAQLRRLDWLLGRLRRARDLIFSRVGEGKSFRRVFGNDPEGGAGWFTPLILPSEEACQAFASAVRARGVHHVSTAREAFAGGEIYHCYPVMAHEQFIPNRGAHWAAKFSAMVEKRSIDPRFNPWAHPLYDGDVSYAEGFMDDSLALIKRVAMIQTNPRLEPEHCEAIADAIRAADEAAARLL